MFDAEVMSIIGSINKKNQEIRSKFNKMTNTKEDNNTTIPRVRTLNTIQDDDVLKNMIMELSVEEQDSSDYRKDNLYNSNLEQTIIIGEMDEGNIFDDLNDGKNDDDFSSKEVGESITMTKNDLKEVVDNIKTRYIAEIDAIMLE